MKDTTMTIHLFNKTKSRLDTRFPAIAPDQIVVCSPCFLVRITLKYSPLL